MKTLFISFFLSMNIYVISQEIEKEATINGFGGPYFNISNIQNQLVFDMGGGGGIIVNQKYFFGGFGQGTITPIKPKTDSLKAYEYNSGKGGLWFGYLQSTKRIGTFTLNLKLAWGGIGLFDHTSELHNASYMSIEPEIGYDIPITRFLKAGMGISYPFHSKIEIPGLNESELSKLHFSFMFKFGTF